MPKLTKKMALKPFLETVEKYCSQLSKQQLLETILNIAQMVPQEQRSDFLHRITPTKNQDVEVMQDDEENIIDDICGLREEIEERIASIENGSYYEEYEAWDEYNYDEEPEYISEEQKEALEALFRATDVFFLSNQLKVAKEAFEQLFELQLEDFSLDIDLREPRARYCRCIYELVPSQQRIQALLEGIVPRHSLRFEQRPLFTGKYPFLQDIIDARPGELPDFEQFLPAWEKALAKLDSERAALLRLETIDFMKGLEGISTQARKWSKNQPLGYIFWLEKLIAQKAWTEVASVSQEALAVLPEGNYRAEIADFLMLAAQATNDFPLILKGKQEHFLSVPTDRSLLNWINEAEFQQQKTEALQQVLHFLPEKKGKSSLYVKASLMAGEIDKAFERVKDAKPVSWSHHENPVGVVFAGILIALLPDHQQPTQIFQDILARYSSTEYYSFERSFESSLPEKNSLKLPSMTEQIIQGLREQKGYDSQRTLWLEWAEKIGKQRVEHIVSNKHRDAYERAAKVLGALGEYFILSDQETHGISLITHYRNVQFNRHSAFRRELDHVIASSKLLRTKGIVKKH